MILELYSDNDELLDSLEVQEIHVFRDEIIYLPCNSASMCEKFETHMLSPGTHYKVR